MRKQLVVLITSTLIGLMIVEAGLQLRERSDDRALLGRRVPDPILEWRMPANRYGHDANGFRNAAVPARADIVVLGDSQSWGVNVTREGTWPSLLARLSGRSVYNMSMVGCGPAQHWALLPQVHALQPSVIVVQLYLGNDALDAYRATYSLDHYAKWRITPLPGEVPQESLSARPRRWSRSLATLRFLFQGVDLKRQFDRSIDYARARPEGAAIVRSGTTIRTILRIDNEALQVDQTRPVIADGMRLTMEYLSAIQSTATARVMFLLFPSKARVFAGDVDHTGVAVLAAAQAAISARIQAWCEASGAACVDALQEFRDARGRTEPLYPITDEIHPTAVGYQLVAEKVRRAIGARGW